MNGSETFGEKKLLQVKKAGKVSFCFFLCRGGGGLRAQERPFPPPPPPFVYLSFIEQLAFSVLTYK